MEYTKPPLSFEEQADRLLSRGLVADKDELITRLKSVNYYRLSAYLYPYRNTDDSFKENTSLHIVWKHYTFDRQLRLLVMDAVERVEVAVRTQMVYHFAHLYGAFGYLDHTNLPNMDNENFTQWIDDLYNETRRSKERFVEHFKNKYGDLHDRLPIWMLAEIMSFGRMLTMFNGIDSRLKRTIAQEYKIQDDILQNWLGALNVIRNICAHHGRLWNRELAYKFYIPRINKAPEWHVPVKVGNNRIFTALTVLRYLLRYIAPSSGWQMRMYSLLRAYPEVSVSSMGFPDGWEESPLWE
jgi:abortive infection bacteriophage resistance protein